MKLLAIILAFALYHYVEKPQWLRSFHWLEALKEQIKDSVEGVRLQWAMLVLLPLTGFWFVFHVLADIDRYDASYLLLSVAVLYYCLGPRTIESQLASKSLRSQLGIADDAEPSEVVYAITDAALHRWFGVFFWYVLLGVYGALGYRIACHLAHLKDENDEFEKHALQVLEFPVTVLMTVSLALASDFDRIWKHCKQYLTRETLLSMNSLFLYKSMDFAVEHCEIETEDENKEQIVEITTFTVLKRMLVVWLVFVALLVLFTKG